MTRRRDGEVARRRMPPDPVLIAYGVRTTKSARNVWTRIGEAYPHDDGAGLTVYLHAVPRDGKIVLLERDDADDARLRAVTS